MSRYKKLTQDQVSKIRRLFKDFPALTNGQIAELVGCSDSSVGAERRGDRTPKTDEKRAAFEAALASLGKAPLSTEEDQPRETFSGGTPPAAPVASLEDRAHTLAIEIRVQALTALRKQLTNGDISPDDALAALEQK